MWGSPQGVNSVMKMLDAVFSDLGRLALDATTSITNSESSVCTLEMRFKRVFSLSKSHVLQSADLFCEYQRMAGDFVRLEKQTHDTSTDLGKKWAKRASDPKLETTSQARSNVIMHGVLDSMCTNTLTADEREKEMAKLWKMREYAHNIAMMIDIFGWGVVPLMSGAPWRQV
jgi:hypothetical protein